MSADVPIGRIAQLLSQQEMTRAQIKAETGYDYNVIESCLYALDEMGQLTTRTDGMGIDHCTYTGDVPKAAPAKPSSNGNNTPTWNFAEEVRKILRKLPAGSKFTAANLYDKLPDAIIKFYDNSPSYIKNRISIELNHNRLHQTAKLVELDHKLPSGQNVYRRLGEQQVKDEPEPLTCADCGAPRSVGSAERCRKCYEARAAARKPTQALEVATPQQIESVDKAQYSTDLGIPADDDKPRSQFCLTHCYPGRIDIGHHISCDYWTDEEREVMKEAIAEETVQRAQEQRKATAAIMELAAGPQWDDGSFFPNAYDTLIGILDHDMNTDEKDAVWILIRYLKRLQAMARDA